MDFLKKAAAAASGGDNNNNNNNNSENQQPPQQQGGDNNQEQKQTQQSGDQQDYGDKAFDMISKKAGLNLSRENQEKITDGARNAYESYSGKKVDAKYSN